jgi:cadaverine:lysine antiporter
VLVLIPVVMTAVVGWHWFDVATYQANWNTSSTTDSHAVIKSILLCLWAFVGVESAAVSTGMVKNPKRTVPLATMLGTRWPVSSISPRLRLSPVCILLLRWPRPCAVRDQRLYHSRRLGCADGIRFHRLCLPDFSGLVDDAGWPGRRVPPTTVTSRKCMAKWIATVSEKGLLLAAVKMTALMVLITLMNSAGGKASDLFGELTGIAVLLTMLPYFYSCVDLIRFEGINIRNFVSLICSVLGCVFCFIALMGQAPSNWPAPLSSA